MPNRCDVHHKKLEYFCLGHERYCCRACRADHVSGTCECIHVRDIYDRLQLEMEERLLDLAGMRERSKRILDGSFKRNLLYRVEDEEKHLERFYSDMKRRLKDAKAKVEGFTMEDVPLDLKDQLQTFLAKGSPAKFGRGEDARDMVQAMRAVKKQISGVYQLLHSMPNYVEVSVDPGFMKVIAYNQDPIVIRGRPRYFRAVSDSEQARDNNMVDGEPDPLDDTTSGYSVPSSMEFDGEPARKRTKALPVFKTIPTRRGLAMVRPFGPRNFPPNKYADQIAAAQKRMTVDDSELVRSQTPTHVKNVTIKVPFSSRSLPELKDNLSKYSSKTLGRTLVSKHTKYVVREKIDVDDCIDALVLHDCIVMYKDNFLQKTDRKTFTPIVEMKLPKVIGMCVIQGYPSYIAVLQPNKILVIDTFKGLSVLYKLRLKPDTTYREVCHLNTVDTGPFHPSFLFAVSYAFHECNPTTCIEVVRARETRRRGKPPIFESSASEIPLSNQGYRISVIRGISAFPDGKLCIGTPDAIICVTETGRLIWKTPTTQEVSGMFCTKSMVYACIQAQRKIVILNKAGFVTDDNIIPDLEILPSKLSANWDVLLVKDYRSRKWISVTFKFGLFVM